MSDRPLISIGIPLYNSEAFVRGTIESVLCQTYSNLELVLVDDRSTDASQSICQEYMKKDPRVVYFINRKNIGLYHNHNEVYLRSSGSFFMWMGDHDQLNPECLEKLVEPMLNNPQIVMVYPDYCVLASDHSLRPFGRIPKLETVGLTKFNCCRKVLRNLVPECYYSLFRSDVLAKTSLNRMIWGHDSLLIFEMSLYGEIKRIPELLFYFVLNHGDIDINSRIREQLRLLPRPLCIFQNELPRIVLSIHFIDVIHHAELTLSEKEVLYKLVIPYKHDEIGVFMAFCLLNIISFFIQLKEISLHSKIMVIEIERLLHYSALFKSNFSLISILEELCHLVVLSNQSDEFSLETVLKRLLSKESLTDFVGYVGALVNKIGGHHSIEKKSIIDINELLVKLNSENFNR